MNSGKADAVGPGQVEVSDPAMLAEHPLISVLMIVYNHAEYLAEAIESIVSQRVNFPFELVIGEDASSDGSLDIALKYQSKYPHLIRVIHSGANVGMNANSRRVRKAARGKYLAWCEGDDYWCDRDKLAKQAALLESDERIGAVHSDWVRAYRVGETWRVDWKETAHARMRRSLLSGDLLSIFHHPKILRTCTLMFRASIARECDCSIFGRRNYGFGDTVTSLFITSKWKVAYLPEVTAVYRVSENSALRSGKAARIRFLMSALQFDDDVRANFPRQTLVRYPDSFRLEVAAGLLLWSIRAGDGQHVWVALKELLRMGPWRCFCAGCASLRTRTPTLRRQAAVVKD
jgi:glycosyltransferase involved in cell wall biosynthesis